MQFCIMHQTCLDHLFVCKAMADWYDGKWILMLKLMALVALQLYFTTARQTHIMFLDWSEGGCCCEWWWWRWLIFTCFVFLAWLTDSLIIYYTKAMLSHQHSTIANITTTNKPSFKWAKSNRPKSFSAAAARKKGEKSSKMMKNAHVHFWLDLKLVDTHSRIINITY